MDRAGWQADDTLAPGRAAASGAVAAVVYLVVMYADMAVTHSPSDDLLMLGRPLTANPRLARLLGLPTHLGFGVAVGLAYGAYGHRRLRGPNWLRGASMLMLENTVLWPASLAADRWHPAMRSGELPRLNTPVPFAQQIARHLAFGAALGLLYADGRPSA
jgi:hypothetical protein